MSSQLLKCSICGRRHSWPREQPVDETAELIHEWRKTCRRLNIPFYMRDAVQFAKDMAALAIPAEPPVKEQS